MGQDAGAGARGTTLVANPGPRGGEWKRAFNPFRDDTDTRWPATAGVYEPLLVYSRATRTYQPWLATGYQWGASNLTVRFAIRPGVVWSDGQPFSGGDVAFTFDLMRRFSALDRAGVWGFLADVKSADGSSVEFAFKRAYTPGLLAIGTQPIVAEHKWKDVAQPTAFDDPSPAGTGPFTEVRRFEPNVYEPGRNARYWQKDKLGISALRVPLYRTNAEMLRALEAGELDWASLFVDDVEKRWVAKDPARRLYWYPDFGPTVLLELNTRRGDWTRRDVARANALLDAAGLARGEGGVRAAPGGDPMRYDLVVVEGWSDWGVAAGIIRQNLAEVGIEVTVKALAYDAWVGALERGRFDMGMWFGERGPTPYEFYKGQMDSALVKPVGEKAIANFHRFASEGASRALRRFEASSDPVEQQRLGRELQKIYVDSAPSLPLFASPLWGVFNAGRVTGFPSRFNPTRAPPRACTRTTSRCSSPSGRASQDPRRMKRVTVTVGLLTVVGSCLYAGRSASEGAARSSRPSGSVAAAMVVRRYAAPEARQAVAVDAAHFYAITNAWIAKYEKDSGQRAAEWKGSPDGPIRHLNSGIVQGSRLYCAHSNYPDTPMQSSIEIFDTATLQHLDSHGLGSGHGSATWIDTRDDAWWVAFAHYAGKGGEPGRGPEHTKLVQYDRTWRELDAWTFPKAVIDRWDGMSSSGGAWAPDGRLVTTSHHGTELFILRLPTTSPVLELDAVVPFESEGQGIAIDAATGLLWSIQRRTGEVLVSRLP